jgi:hypothetical protein
MRPITAIMGPQIDSSDWEQEKKNAIKKEDQSKGSRVVIINGEINFFDNGFKRIKKSTIKGRNIRNAL